MQRKGLSGFRTGTRTIVFFLVAVVSASFDPAALSAKPLTEVQKIQALLNAIGNAKGMIFIRNGSEHNAARAKSHLAYKYSRTKSRIRTARHFIKYLATKSSWTGRAYTVRLKNGKTLPSALWLTARLKEIEAKDRKKNPKR